MVCVRARMRAVCSPCAQVHTWTAYIDHTAKLHTPVMRATQDLFSTVVMQAKKRALQKLHQTSGQLIKAGPQTMWPGARVRMLGVKKKFVHAEVGEIMRVVAVCKSRTGARLKHQEWMWLFERERTLGKELLVMVKGEALFRNNRRAGWTFVPPRPEDALVDFGETDMALGATVGFDCPLGKERIRIPVRGAQCNHHQCFDRDNWLLHCMVRVTRYCRTVTIASCQ